MERSSNSHALTAVFFLAGLVAPSVLHGQVPAEERLVFTLRANTVAVRSVFSDGTTETGFGIIVGEQHGTLWVATPNHLLRGISGDWDPVTVDVRFHGLEAAGQSASLLSHKDASLDLAVLRISKPDGFIWYPWAMGAADEITRGDAVWYIGQAGRWYVPSTPGRINEVDPAFGIVVDGLNTQVGSSGAPLVSAAGIVGMIATDAFGATENAVPLNVIAERFTAWGLPWSLAPLSLARTRPLPLRGVDEALAEGDALRAEDDLAGAAARYQRALEIDPNDTHALRRSYEVERALALAETRYPTRLFMDDEQSATAVRRIYRLLDLDETLWNVELQLQVSTLTRLAKGNWSIEYLTNALQRYVDDPRIRAELGLVQAGYVAGESGLELLASAYEERPDDPLVNRFRAYAFELARDYPNAARYYARAIEYSADDSTISSFNRTAGLRAFVRMISRLEEEDPGASYSTNPPVQIAESAALLSQFLADGATPGAMTMTASGDGTDGRFYILARMRWALGEPERARSAALRALGFPSGRGVGFRIEGLAATDRVEFAVDLLRQSGSEPALLYALERGVLGLDARPPSTWQRPALQLGHSGRVLALATSPDGRFIVSGGDHSLRVWNASTGQLARMLGPLQGSVCGLAFREGSTQVLAMEGGGSDKTVHVWDLETGRRVQSAGNIVSNSCTAALDHEGAIIAEQRDTKMLMAWPADSAPRPLGRLPHSIRAVGASLDGRTVAIIPCCGESDRLELRDTEDGAPVKTIELSTQSSGLTFSPSGDRIAVVGGNDVVEVIDTKSGARLQTLHTEVGRTVESIAFSPDGTLLAIGSWDGQAMQVWEVAAGRRLMALDGQYPVTSVAWLPDGQLVASTTNGDVSVWNVATEQRSRRFTRAAGENTMALSPDGELLVIGTDGNVDGERVQNVTVWELADRRVRCHIGGGPFNAIAFSPDNRWIALGNSSNYRVEIWDTRCQTQTGEVQVYPNGIAFAPTGSLAYVDYRDGSKVVLRDPRTFELIRVLEVERPSLGHIMFHPHDGRLAAADRDGTVLRVCDTTTGRQVLSIDAPEG